MISVLYVNAVLVGIALTVVAGVCLLALIITLVGREKNRRH
jgi:hypothetical protein